MIKASRLNFLYESSDEKTKRLVIKQLEFYILDNPQFTDRYNFEWLSDIFMALSFNRVYKAAYMEQSEILSTLRKAMQDAEKESIALLEEESKNPNFINTLTKKAMKYKKKNIGYGWKIDFPPSSERELRITVDQCLVRKICMKYEANYLIPLFCGLHQYQFETLSGIYFICSDQLMQGAKCCDFTIRSKLNENKN